MWTCSRLIGHDLVLLLIIFTHLEIQCIVKTQHCDYVQSMKPGGREGAAGGEICDLKVRRAAKMF